MCQSEIDLAGVGIGPFNLSLAALLAPAADTAVRFFDRRPHFAWHPGLMLPDARLQTSFLKDLVTAVDPTSPYSFLAYLVERRRFYEFVNADFKAVSRLEFSDYLAWAARRVPGLYFGTTVHEVRFEDGAFRVATDGEAVAARNLCVAQGQQPFSPAWARDADAERCFHAAEILDRRPAVGGLRVAIVGGGQTGAEVFLTLARGHFGDPRSIAWISRRPNFEPLDETHFTNEYFSPGYLRHFHGLPEARRTSVLAGQKLASDGISPSTLEELYQLLYRDRHLTDKDAGYLLLPGREAIALQRDGAAMRISARSPMAEGLETVDADLVILCTGYHSVFPQVLKPLAERLDLDAAERPRLDPHFRVLWDGPSDRRIYLQNYARHSHGIADPQLSLMAWRSAVIANDLLGGRRYDVDDLASPITWHRASSAPGDETRAA